MNESTARLIMSDAMRQLRDRLGVGSTCKIYTDPALDTMVDVYIRYSASERIHCSLLLSSETTANEVAVYLLEEYKIYDDNYKYRQGIK